MSGLPLSIVAVDVETTGLGSDDRIVTLGAWRMNTADLNKDALKVEWLHIIADPGKKSHPRAEQVHGYSDWILRHQQPFHQHAQVVKQFLSGGEIIVAHNASFDLGFISREYRAIGEPELICRRFCTMNAYRRSGLPGRASLNAICQQIGLKRIEKTHGALEDAWLALMVYLWLHQTDPRHIKPFHSVLDLGVSTKPTNFIEPPPLPNGILPQRHQTQDYYQESSRGAKLLNRLDKIAKEALLKEVRPTAILLLEIARADKGLASEELDILTSLIRTTNNRLNFGVDEEVEREILTHLTEIELSQNMLTRAARALCENPFAREAFPKRLAEMATANGELSAVAQEGVEWVKAAIRRVLPRQT